MNRQLGLPSPTSPSPSPSSSPRPFRKRRQMIDSDDSDDNLCPPKSPCQSPIVSPLGSPRSASPAPAFDFSWLGDSVLPAVTVSPPNCGAEAMDMFPANITRCRQDSVDSGGTFSTRSRENSFDSISTWYRSREGSYDSSWYRSREGSCDSNASRDSGLGWNYRLPPDPRSLHAFFGVAAEQRRNSMDLFDEQAEEKTHLQIARNKLALALPQCTTVRSERRRSSCKEITLTLFPRCIEEEDCQPLYETIESKRRFSLGQTSPDQGTSPSPKSPESPRPRHMLSRSLSADTASTTLAEKCQEEGLYDSLPDLSRATIKDLTRRAQRRGAVCYSDLDSALTSLRHLSVDEQDDIENDDLAEEEEEEEEGNT
ncbi:unnamed protein product [Dimorphilus gyrociliatus]|uniref:Uncharacterized protein n=1 Tax=Dimorphilus gyrociliatus TaxID=2664684 RepID=A0A7I8VS55_9ANNE|nr:unnamed protein product [Dimorphilus gyrociliatus]